MNDLVLRALRGEPVERVPVWFMRQAGRYLPEYRAVRARLSFLELCKDPDTMAEVTIQPIDRFGCDAAIVFSDILVVLEAIGRPFHFDGGHGPVVPSPVRDAAAAATLVRPDVADALPHAPEAIRRFIAARPETPILGFAGAPFTLLCYLVEGKGSRSFEAVKKLLFSDPDTAERLLGLLADVAGDYLQLQVDAGAAAVQLFDTWAGILSPEDWERWSLPFVQRAFARVSGVPRLYFTRDSAVFLDRLTQTGADALSLDWRLDLRAARARLGPIPVQGNLDPTVLYAPEAEIRRRVRAILDAGGGRGHVFNLGHGVLPDTPISGVEAMIDEVRRYRIG